MRYFTDSIFTFDLLKFSFINRTVCNLFGFASLVYNIGETAFVKSTLLNLLNQSAYQKAANQFDRWVYDNGKRIQGLVNRRKKEKGLFLKAL